MINSNKKLNNIPAYKKCIVSPENWIDNYCDDFFDKALLFTNDREMVLTIIEETFLKGGLTIDEYTGDEDEYTWLLKILNSKINEKSNNVFVIDNSNELFSKHLDNNYRISKEIFELKTFQNKSTAYICKKFKINEKQFWEHIHKTRTQLIEEGV